MWQTILKYGSVFFGSMFKFVLGPTFGAAEKLSIPEIVFFTVAGMMASVVGITLLGERSRKYFERKNKKVFTKRNKFLVKAWTRFGIIGVAFLTPLILTPIGGTIVAVSFRVPRRKIFLNMFIFAVLWALILSVLFVYFEKELSKILH